MSEPSTLKLMFDAGYLSAKIDTDIAELNELTEELIKLEEEIRMTNRGASAEAVTCPDCSGYKCLTAPNWATDHSASSDAGGYLTVVHKWFWHFMDCPTCDGAGWVFQLEIHKPFDTQPQP